MKELYIFTVKEEVEDGDPIMHQFMMKKPNRREIEEADMEYSVAMSNAIARGVLTKQMLAKKYSDTGGLMSEDDASELFKLYGRLRELSTKFSEIKVLGDESNNEKLEAIGDELIILRREIVEKETSYQSLFDHTAEIKAQNKLIQWYVLNLTHRHDHLKEEYVPYFEGDTYGEKVENWYRLEDESEDDSVYFKVMAKASLVYSLWFFNQIDSPEEFEKFINDSKEEKPVDEEVAPKKKAAKKRAPRKKAAPKEESAVAEGE